MEAYIKNVIKLGLLLLLTIGGCRHLTAPDNNPQWVNNLIIKFEGEPVGSPPQSIWRYEYKGQFVYYVPAQCCDQFSTLYDSNGNMICAPDGGFTGHGDGGCSDFFQSRRKETLIWRDPRKN